MRLFSRRPFAAAVCIALPIAASAARFSTLGRVSAMLFVLILTVLGARFFARRPSFTCCSLKLGAFISLAGVLSLALLAGSHLLHEHKIAEFDSKIGERVSVRAIVTDLRLDAEYGSIMELELISLDGEVNGERGLIFCDTSAGVSLGDIITAEAEFCPIESAVYGSGSDRTTLISDGVRFVLSCESLTKDGSRNTPDVLFAKLRERLCAELSVRLDRESAALSSALLLDERDDLGLLRRDFYRAGTIHLLALSGTHLSLLCAVLSSITERLKFGRKTRIFAELAFVIFYAALTGFPSSLMRAAVMLWLTRLAILVGRDRDSLTALFGAVYLIVLVDPSAIGDLGLTMSFVATLGVLIFGEKSRLLGKKIGSRLLRRLTSLFLISLGATLFLIPIYCIKFGEMSIWSVPATLALTPFVGALLVLLVPYIWLSLAGFGLAAGALALPISGLAKLICTICRTAAETNSLVCLTYPFTLPILLVCVIVLIFMSFKSLSKPLASLIPIGLSIAIFSTSVVNFNHHAEPRIFTVRERTNELLISSSGETCVLVDISSGATSVMRLAASALPIMYASEIDTCMLTHLHRRHKNSLRVLCENRLVRRFLLPEPLNEAERVAFADIAELASELGVELLTYSRADGEGLRIDRLSVKVDEPCYIPRSSHPIISVKIESGGREVYYLGAAYSEYMPLPEAELLLLGSHGPKAYEPLPGEMIAEGVSEVFCSQ